MKSLAIIFGLVFMLGCASRATRNTLILDYGDFGPQAAAYKALGMEWWQWENHGDSNPRTSYDIKVVVYRNIPLLTVQRRYPVDKNRQRDYRYLAYPQALAYLDKQIAEDILPELTQKHKKTKAKIQNAFKDRSDRPD